MVEFFQKVGDAFNGLGEFLTGPWGYLVLFIFLLSLVGFIIARHFRKIIKKEMDFRGEEYGEIASAKILHNAGVIAVFSILGMLATFGVVIYYFILQFRG